jgi:hypothetical protein
MRSVNVDLKMGLDQESPPREQPPGFRDHSRTTGRSGRFETGNRRCPRQSSMTSRERAGMQRTPTLE